MASHRSTANRDRDANVGLPALPTGQSSSGTKSTISSKPESQPLWLAVKSKVRQVAQPPPATLQPSLKAPPTTSTRPISSNAPSVQTNISAPTVQGPPRSDPIPSTGVVSGEKAKQEPGLLDPDFGASARAVTSGLQQIIDLYGKRETEIETIWNLSVKNVNDREAVIKDLRAQCAGLTEQINRMKIEHGQLLTQSLHQIEQHQADLAQKSADLKRWQDGCQRERLEFENAEKERNAEIIQLRTQLRQSRAFVENSEGRSELEVKAELDKISTELKGILHVLSLLLVPDADREQPISDDIRHRLGALNQTPLQLWAVKECQKKNIMPVPFFRDVLGVILYEGFMTVVFTPFRTGIPKEVDATMKDLHSAMFKKESQAWVGRWRSMSYKNLEPLCEKTRDVLCGEADKIRRTIIDFAKVFHPQMNVATVLDTLAMLDEILDKAHQWRQKNMIYCLACDYVVRLPKPIGSKFFALDRVTNQERGDGFYEPHFRELSAGEVWSSN